MVFQCVIVTDLILTNYSKKKKLLIEEAILNHQMTFEKSESVTAVKLMNTSKVVACCSRTKQENYHQQLNQ